MTADRKVIRNLIKVAYDPYDRIEHPSAEDWQKSYDALKELCVLKPRTAVYPNTLGYLCYYGRHTGGERQYEEARQWFEKGAKLRNIESTYKLADMLAEGLGGPKDPKRALHNYLIVYWFCREQFESGVHEGKFADTALRMGRIYHEGKIVHQSDTEALGYLLEAKYAINRRKQYNCYGDDVVEKNIDRLIDECDKPDDMIRNLPVHLVHPEIVPWYLIPSEEYQMTIDLQTADDGDIRLEFRRRRRDGKKPARILWTVPPAMKCFTTDFVVLYGKEVREIWNIRPGEQVLCDRYEYDEEKDTHLFFLGEDLQFRLAGGIYALPMHEFLFTEMMDHPQQGSDIPQ